MHLRFETHVDGGTVEITGGTGEFPRREWGKGGDRTRWRDGLVSRKFELILIDIARGCCSPDWENPTGYRAGMTSGKSGNVAVVDRAETQTPFWMKAAINDFGCLAHRTQDT